LGRLQIIMPDSLERRLRNYINRKYLKTHGMITEVVCQAVEEFLDKEEKKGETSNC